MTAAMKPSDSIFYSRLSHLQHFPTISFTDPEDVQCYSLNGLRMDMRVSKIDLLWVDIQGAEKEMIEHLLPR